MSAVYPDDYPKTREEALRALASVRDEDIDYSDIPPIGDNVIVTPIGRKFIEMGRRNLERMSREAEAL
ncbi:MAG: hypothetical protein IJP89_00545 [Synergistaceae bacterium]|nr:hypothetical protein [Synergistaceae bacterium]MBR0149832.1 hypothetical protein [Synergistaceae bacterium]MBR0257445.1 hypothetical protein [Synergistaceae bacterium]